MDHRIGRIVFALVVGLAVAVFSYQWITNPAPRTARAVEEQVVEDSRLQLRAIVVADALEIVDPLSPNRKVGKVYVYAEGPGWAVSGYYRRNEEDRWHPYLLTLTEDLQLVRLKAEDSRLIDQAKSDPRLDISP